MKFRVTMKDPDTLSDAVRVAVEREFAALDLDDDEREAALELRCDKVYEACSRWFEYGEYLTVEIDTNKKTCFVVERAK